MNIEKFADEIAAKLKEDDFFSDTKIIRAYPNVRYFGQMTQSAVVIGFESAEITPYEIGGCAENAEICIFADIYAPLKQGVKRIYDVFSEICEVCREYNIVKISAERAEYNSKTEAMKMKTKIAFKTVFVSGGESSD